MDLNFSIAEILYLFAAFHGVFLALLLILKKRASNNIYLFFLILLFSFFLIENVIYISGYIKQLPHFYFVTRPVIYLIGPLFYTYIRSSLNVQFSLKWNDLIHLTPFLIQLAVLIPFYLLSAEIKISIYEMSQDRTSSWEFSIYFLVFLVYIGSTCWYFFASSRLLKKYAPPTGRKERKKIIWLKNASIGFYTYTFISLILSILVRPFPELIDFYFHANLICMTLLIHAVGYVAFMSPDLFNGYQPSNYQFSVMSKETIDSLTKKLEQVMVADRPYLNAEITADDISKSLDITKHQLSQLLNVGLNTRFYDYINQYRIEHSKNILKSDEYQEAKILHIAFDSGFSNKASFLRNFKKLTGLTPTAYKNLHENQVSIN